MSPRRVLSHRPVRWLLARSLHTAFLALALAGTVRAEQVAVLGDEVLAAEARVVAVLDAEEEIFVSTFIVGDEPFSLTALSLLRHAARRGLDVRLLVDAQWNKMPPSVEAHLLAEGVAIRRFHPFRLRHPLWITKRLHDKLLIVDGQTLVVGGRNLESPYFGFGRQLERRDYVDLDLLVEGAVVREVGAFLDEHLERARRIDTRGWPEGADGPYPGVPRGKVHRLRLLRLLAPFIRSQL